MTAERWERYAPWTGVLAVFLWVAGFLILMSPGTVAGGASPEQVIEYHQTNAGPVIGGSFIFMLGVLSFVWFLGSLAASLHAAEGGAGGMASTAFGGGLAMAVCALLLPSGGAAVALGAGTMSPAAGDVLRYMPAIFFIGVELFAVVLVGATALLTLRTAALPRWLGWVSLVLALVLLIPPIGWLGMLVGIPAWIVTVSLLLTPTATQRL